jgi:hypothetical protein
MAQGVVSEFKPQYHISQIHIRNGLRDHQCERMVLTIALHSTQANNVVGLLYISKYAGNEKSVKTSNSAFDNICLKIIVLYKIVFNPLIMVSIMILSFH